MSGATTAKDDDDSSIIWDVIVIGAGVAGATAAHAIAQVVSQHDDDDDDCRSSTRILVLERGVPGRGDETSVLENVLDGETPVIPGISGSAVFSEKPKVIKMMVGLYACTSQEFLREHSVEDAKTWFAMTQRGLDLQKSKAKAIMSEEDQQQQQHIHELGSIMVAPHHQKDELDQEFQLLQQANCPVQKMTTEQVLQAMGEDSGFTEGLFFPQDAIIDSSWYAQALLDQAATIMGGDDDPTQFQIRKVQVDSILQDATQDQLGTIQCSNGQIYTSRNIVVTTGAFYHKGPLEGLLKPCYSYLVGMPGVEGGAPGMDYPNSPNLFTYGFSHDWCMTDGICRMSGEDHFSALKLPHCQERCHRLAQWTYQRYPKQLPTNLPYSQQYGVYSETPDLLPIFGTTCSSAKTCYLVGCNAWGQAIMSSLGHLVPAILGFRPFQQDEKRIANLCSIQRFPIACQRHLKDT